MIHIPVYVLQISTNVTKDLVLVNFNATTLMEVIDAHVREAIKLLLMELLALTSTNVHCVNTHANIPVSTQ